MLIYCFLVLNTKLNFKQEKDYLSSHEIYVGTCLTLIIYKITKIDRVFKITCLLELI